MKKVSAIFLGITVLLTLGAVCNKQAKAFDRCYALADDPDQTIIRIMDKPGDGFNDPIIVSDPNGKNAEQFLGKVEAGTFSYEFPGKWVFNEQDIRGEGSIIDGITGKATTCPDLNEYEYITE